MDWLPEDFFIGQSPALEARPNRPIGQGDVFESVPVAGRTASRNGQTGLKAKTAHLALVVASSCGMRKGPEGALSDVIHVAPIRRLHSLAPGWAEPWEGWLNVLPLPGLTTADGSPAAADLSRIGLCGSDSLELARRRACVSLPGMKALKARIASYFIRVDVPPDLVGVGAHEEWHELSLWEHWAQQTGHDAGFQAWLDETNPAYPSLRRRDTIYDDLGGIETQLNAAIAKRREEAL